MQVDPFVRARGRAVSWSPIAISIAIAIVMTIATACPFVRHRGGALVLSERQRGRGFELVEPYCKKLARPGLLLLAHAQCSFHEHQRYNLTMVFQHNYCRKNPTSLHVRKVLHTSITRVFQILPMGTGQFTTILQLFQELTET